MTKKQQYLKILDVAKQNVSQSNSFTFYLAKFFIGSNKLQYFYYWYAYFRWVDDIADSNNQHLMERMTFINSQIELVDVMYSGIQANKINNDGEHFLYELINFDKLNGEKLKESINQMLLCIQNDISRIGNYSHYYQLDDFFNKEVLSYLNTFQFFCTTKKTFLTVKTSKEGNAGKWVHVLRDYIKDKNEKIFNLPIEDFNKYALNPSENFDYLKTKAFKNWVYDKLEDAKVKFKEGKIENRKHPSLKYKILVLILCFKYNLYLKEIEKYECELQYDYKISKTSMLISLPKLLIEVLIILWVHYENKIRTKNKI